MVLYIGNILSKHGKNPTTIETLGKYLSKLGTVKLVSDNKNIFFRILDIWFSIIFTKNLNFVIIDTYSTNAFNYAWTSAIICVLKKVKYVPILHGGNLPESVKRKPFLFRFYFDNAFKIITPSNFLKSNISEFTNRTIQVIPNIIELDKYKPIKKKYDKINLLWVRAFDKIYNPDYAIKILKKLKELGYTKSKLCMIGPDKDGSLKSVKNLINEYKFSESVEITGKLSKNEWVDKSKNFNFFINTTSVDNTPVSLIEAMALGIPVISTNVGGIPFLIKDNYNGKLTNVNTDEMVDAIIELYNNEKQRNFIIRKAIDYSKKFDWESVKKFYFFLFE